MPFGMIPASFIEGPDELFSYGNEVQVRGGAFASCSSLKRNFSYYNVLPER